MPLLCHWYVSGAAPLATTEKDAVCPAVTDCDAGCVVIVGAAGCDCTGAILVPPHPAIRNMPSALEASNIRCMEYRFFGLK